MSGGVLTNANNSQQKILSFFFSNTVNYRYDGLGRKVEKEIS